MVETRVCSPRCEKISEYPDHVRSHVVEILKTGSIKKDLLNEYDIPFYLAIGHMSPPLKRACEDILLDNLNNVNCIDALDIADKFELLSLRKESMERLVNTFDKIWNSTAFLNLSEKNLDSLCNVAKIAKHKDVYPALQNWLSFDHKKRFNEYLRLLDVLQQRRTRNRQMSCSEKYSEYHAILMLSPGKSKNTIVTAVFNCDGEIVCHRNLFKSTDIKEDVSVTCVQKNESEEPYVFILSGKHAFRYDPMLNKHDVCEKLCKTRVQGSLATHRCSVFAIGGHNCDKNVLDIEELDTKLKTKLTQKKKWKVVAHVPEGIKLRSAPCVNYKDHIYIIGERSNETEPSTVILEFNPFERSVKTIGEFPKKCSDCRAVRHGSSIFISSSEGYFLEFDTDTNVFTSCTDLPFRGKEVGIYAKRDKIYITGNKPDDENNLIIHEYDIQTNSWKKVRNFRINSKVRGVCDIKVPSYTNVVPFYDCEYKEIK